MILKCYPHDGGMMEVEYLSQPQLKTLLAVFKKVTYLDCEIVETFQEEENV